MHVATTKRKYKGVTYKNYLIRQNYRENGKVKHKTIANITHLPPDLIETIRKRLKEGKPISEEGFSIIRSLPHGHVEAILQTIKRIGLDNIIGSKRSKSRDIILGLIIQRLIRPDSKLGSLRNFKDSTATNSVGSELELDSLTRSQLYTALDWLEQRQKRIEKKLAGHHLKAGTIVLYDISGSYYTGKETDLVQYGYNRDKKRGYPQIVYGLICNSEGCPVAVEVFSGDTTDSETLSSQIEKVRRRFGIKQVVWVGDRGMITGKLIQNELRGNQDIDWITALRAPQIKKLVREQPIQLSLFDERNLVEIEAKDYPGERLVVCRNPLLAEQRRLQREDLLKATREELDKIVEATHRRRKPLRGKDAIGVKVGKVIDKYKMGKHISYSIEEDGFTYEINQESVSEEQTLDGVYVIRTSLAQKAYSAENVVETYKSLSQVERAFRSMKTTRLQIRPIYHWTENRIRAHVFLCMLAYYVEWHINQKLAPYLYSDDQKEKGKQKRDSVIDPAQKSDAAIEKTVTHQAEDGTPVNSMDTIIDFLGTICKNKMQYDNHDEPFYTITQPTKEQQKILDLLEVKL